MHQTTTVEEKSERVLSVLEMTFISILKSAAPFPSQLFPFFTKFHVNILFS
jgi:hypothetical protein